MSNTDKCGNQRKGCKAGNDDGFIVPGGSKDQRGVSKLLVRGKDKVPVLSQTGLCLVWRELNEYGDQNGHTR